MSNNKKLISTIALGIVVAFSCLMFFGISNSEKTNIEISSFIFVLVTEAIIYGYAMACISGKLNTFMTAGAAAITFIYSICSLLFNVVLIGVFSSLRINLIFNIGALLVYTFMIVLLLLFKKENK